MAIALTTQLGVYTIEHKTEEPVQEGMYPEERGTTDSELYPSIADCCVAALYLSYIFQRAKCHLAIFSFPRPISQEAHEVVQICCAWQSFWLANSLRLKMCNLFNKHPDRINIYQSAEEGRRLSRNLEKVQCPSVRLENRDTDSLVGLNPCLIKSITFISYLASRLFCCSNKP